RVPPSRSDRILGRSNESIIIALPNMITLNWARLRDQCIVALVVLVFLWAAFQLLDRVLHIVVVVLLALVLAYALEPPLSWAERVLPRAAAALLIYATALGLLAAGVLIVV